MTAVWTPLAPVQTLVRTSPDSCRGKAGEPPLTLGANSFRRAKAVRSGVTMAFSAHQARALI
jgi:hypothetical protein